MNKKNDSLYNTISERLKKYRPHLDKIVKKREKSDSFKIILRTENFHDHWPLQYRYHEFDFLKGKTKREKDKVILMYGIKTFIEFEKEIVRSKYKQFYSLYLLFYCDDFFFERDSLLWPAICFCNDRKYLGSYDMDSYIFKTSISEYSDCIRNLLRDLKTEEYFNMFEFNYLDSEIEDVTVMIDFKEHMSKSKINVSELLKVKRSGRN